MGDAALPVPSNTSSTQQTVEVYGLIAAGQASPAGSYSDTVLITLNID